MIQTQNFNTHSFSPHLAKMLGLPSAIFLQHIYYWVKHNKGSNKHFYDGNWWTYNTRKGYANYFEYLTEDQIRGAISKLKTEEILLTGNYNKIAYDRTTWYALSEKGWELFNDAIGENPQWSGDFPQSIGGNPKSKKENSPTYTNSNNKSNTYTLSQIQPIVEEIIGERDISINVQDLTNWINDQEEIKYGVRTIIRRWVNDEKNHIKKDNFNIKQRTKIEKKPREVEALEEEIRQAIWKKCFSEGKQFNTTMLNDFKDKIEIINGECFLEIQPAEEWSWVCEEFNLKVK